MRKRVIWSQRLSSLKTIAEKLIGLFSLTYLCFHGRRGCRQPVRINVNFSYQKPLIL